MDIVGTMQVYKYVNKSVNLHPHDGYALDMLYIRTCIGAWMIRIYIDIPVYGYMRWLRCVGSLKSKISLAEYSLL